MATSIRRLGWNEDPESRFITTSEDFMPDNIRAIKNFGLEKCNEFINMYDENTPLVTIYEKINAIKKKWDNNSYEIHPNVKSRWKALTGGKDPVTQGFFSLKESGSKHPLVILMTE